jgi:hypothetical protein
MTSNEICLHNPDGVPRSYAVRRPDLPTGDALQLDDQLPSTAQPFQVEVPPGATAVVRVLPGGREPSLGRRRQCSLFSPSRAR